jgi:hypothetical protein
MSLSELKRTLRGLTAMSGVDRKRTFAQLQPNHSHLPFHPGAQVATSPGINLHLIDAPKKEGE